jgi:hypothetical protein
MGHECCIRTGKKKKNNNNNNSRRRNLCREETITAAASNRIVTIMPRGVARSPWSKPRRGRRRRRGGTMMDQLEHPWSTTTSTLLSGNAAFCEESAASLWLSLVLFCTTSTATV